MDPDPDEERALDEALDETFPASDPPANTVETGIRLGLPWGAVEDHPTDGRFELVVDGQTAVLTYERRRNSLALLHTEVPPDLRRRGIGAALVKGAVAAARAEGLQILAVCGFAKAVLRQRR